MTSLNKILVTVIATSCLLPFRLSAQDEGFDLDEIEETVTPVYTSEVELGVGYSSEDSFKFGEYSGLEDEGAHFIGNILVRKKSAYDDDSTEYWEFNANNLGLDARSVYAEYGKQGKYNVYLDYDQTPHNRLDDARTPFLGAGSADQTLAANFISTGNNTTGMTNLLTVLNNIEIETERQKFGGGFKWIPMKDWELSADFHHEIKEGSETLGSIFGTNGGNPRSVILAIPVDYDFDEFNIKLSHIGKKAQLQLNYHLSLFNNNNSGGVLWDNPYNAVANWCNACPGGVSPNSFATGGRGRMGLDPDNEAHQITFSGGYTITPTTRLTANVSYGWMTQDETFLPFSTFDSILATTEPLPRTNLDGEINTLYAQVALSTRPLRNLDLRAQFTYDDRDNDTPRDVYLIVHSDVQAQNTSATSTDRRLNRPYSLEKLKFKLDAGYRVGMSSKLSASYEYEENNRDFSEVASTDEHTVKLKFSVNPFAMASGWVQFSHASRDGDTYVSNQPFLDGHDPAVIAAATGPTDPDLFENDPLLRKFYMADRDRNQFKAMVNYYPNDVASISVTGKYKSDKYEETQIGLQESKNTSITFDVTVNPSDKIGTYAYFTFDNYDNNQRGFRRRNTPLPPGGNRNCAGCGFWTIETQDDVYTFGAGLDWVIIKDKFNINLDALYTRAITEVTPDSASQAFLDFPDLTTRLSSLGLTGEYKINENRGLRFKYSYERFKTTDFGLDMVTPDILSNVILLGNSSPDYNAHVFGISYFYNF